MKFRDRVSHSQASARSSGVQWIWSTLFPRDQAMVFSPVIFSFLSTTSVGSCIAASEPRHVRIRKELVYGFGGVLEFETGEFVD